MNTDTNNFNGLDQRKSVSYCACDIISICNHSLRSISDIIELVVWSYRSILQKHDASGEVARDTQAPVSRERGAADRAAHSQGVRSAVRGRGGGSGVSGGIESLFQSH